MRKPVDPQRVPLDDDGAGVREPKREALIKSISKRLRPICSRMPAEEFASMVRDMADIELKYADQSASTHLGRAD